MQPIKLSDFGTKGADLKGIFYLRNVVDADAIVEAIGQAKKKSNKVMTAATIGKCATCHSSLPSNTVCGSTLGPMLLMQVVPAVDALCHWAFTPPTGCKLHKVKDVTTMRASLAIHWAG